ncbi:MAG: PH domain-containing protein [Oscillospiraceae bacterium]|nr:PH domain-containing protein [Oscillospiraceae bacterium]
MKKPETLWNDRRRRLGLPLSFTRYALSEDRLFLEKGLLNTKYDEILLYRVRDISLNITLGQRLFGVGTITVQSSDKSLPVLELKNIKRPREVKELLHQTVEELKIARRMRVGETIYTHDGYDDHDDLIDHDDFFDDDLHDDY